MKLRKRAYLLILVLMIIQQCDTTERGSDHSRQLTTLGDACSQSTIEIGGQYRTMVFTNHQSQPTIQSLVPPIILPVTEKCGSVQYQIISIAPLAGYESGPALSGLFIDSQLLILSSSAYGHYEVIISSGLVNYPMVTIYQQFAVLVVNCKKLNANQIDQNGGLLSCGERLTSQNVSFNLTTNQTTFLNSNVTYFLSSNQGVKNQTDQSTEFQATDPCASLYWYNVDLGVIQYTLGSLRVQVSAILTNSLKTSLCQTSITSVTDNWSDTTAYTSSQTVTATSTNTTVTVQINSNQNSARVKQKTLDFQIQMQSLGYSTITFIVVGQIYLTDPCFDNHVQALNFTNYPLAQNLTFSSSQIDYISFYYGIQNLCGATTATGVTCTGFSTNTAFLDAQKNVVILLDWNKNFIGNTIQCQIQYYSTNYQQTWQGDLFTFNVSDPCTDESQMYFLGQKSLFFNQLGPYYYTACQNQSLSINFTYIQDPISEASGIADFCGLPKFKFFEFDDEYDNSLVGFIEFQIVTSGVVMLNLSPRFCERALIRIYQGWIDRYYSNNTFMSDYSKFFQIILIDPCQSTTFATNQNFFDQSQYYYLVEEPALNFNISAGYVQDSATFSAGIDYYCGLPTFSLIILISPDWISASSTQLSWINLSSTTNQLKNRKDYSLNVYTTSYDDINSYRVSIKIQLGQKSQIYGPTSFTVSDDYGCTYDLLWNDVDFGQIAYQVGDSSVTITKSLNNNLNLQVCRTLVVSFLDVENQPLDWFGFVESGTKTVALTIEKQNSTNRTEFWQLRQPWSIRFTVQMRSRRYENITFSAFGTIQITNPCFVNRISALSNLNYTLAQSVTFEPDLSQLIDQFQATKGLCGPFTPGAIQCSQISELDTSITANVVTLVTRWNRALIGNITCSITYWSTYGSTVANPSAVSWPGESFDVQFSDPCTSEAYLPLTFTQSKYSVDYKICQKQEASINFSFTDSLSTLSGQPGFCGAPVFNFTFADNKLGQQKNLTDSVSVDGTWNTVQMSIKSAMCMRNFNTSGQFQFLSSSVLLYIKINCLVCSGTPFEQLVTIAFQDPCNYASLVDSQPWYDALLVDSPTSQWRKLNVQLGQQQIVYDLTTGYVTDNVTLWSGVEQFCGNPTYNLTYFELQDLAVPTLPFVFISNSTQTIVAYMQFTLNILTTNQTAEGEYRLVLTYLLQPGALLGTSRFVQLKVDNLCKLEFFTFSAVDFGPVNYTLGAGSLTQQRPFTSTNTLGATWCSPYIKFLRQDVNQAGEYSQDTWLATVALNDTTLELDINSSNTTARVLYQTFNFGIAITNEFANGSFLLIKNIGSVVLTDPCFSNSVPAQQSQTFELSLNISFTPELVTDTVSNQFNVAGLCGVIQPYTFSCAGLTQQKAFLSNEKKAVLILDWQKSLIDSFTCKFEYSSTSYQQVWIGETFQVSIIDPCYSKTVTLEINSYSQAYQVCQNSSLVINYNYSDNVSLSSQQTNFCGKPQVSVIFNPFELPVLTTFLTNYTSPTKNSGYLSIKQRMCNRSFARQYPYQVYLSFFYANYGQTQNSSPINIQIDDPCTFTQLPVQDFFSLQYYNFYTFDAPSSLPLSYLPDNATKWSGLDYFCGYPSYELQIRNLQSDILYCSYQGENNITFATLVNAQSYPPENFTSFSIQSQSQEDIGSYLIYAKVLLQNLQLEAQDSVGLKILSACQKSIMVDNFNLTNLAYTLGGKSLNGAFNYTDDTVTTSMLSKYNKTGFCGDHSVACKVISDKNTNFFKLQQNTTKNNYTYYYEIYSNSLLDVGDWRIQCQTSLVKYPVVTPIVNYFQVIITQQIVQGLVEGDCIGSSDAKSCTKFIRSNPPFFTRFLDSKTQFQNVGQVFAIDIQNVYVQYANNISISTVTADFQDLDKINEYLVVGLYAEDPSFQENIGFVKTSQALTKSIQFGLYCPQASSSSVFKLLISLRWKGVDNIQNTYQLPIYCMPCDQNLCSNSSLNFYATRSDWSNQYHPPKVVCGLNCTEPAIQEILVLEAPIYKQNVELSNVNAKPVDKSDPAVRTPDGSASYLDYGFNALVPVYLSNGNIAVVKMCAPSIKTISNTGLVSIEFSKAIIPISKRLYNQIWQSGVIQVQLLLGTEKQFSNKTQAALAYSFQFTIEDISTTSMSLQLNFTSPEYVSSSGSSFDQISISFVNSGRYFKCASSLTPSQANGERLLQSSKEKKIQNTSLSADTTIPSGYRIVFPIPPQVDPDLAAVLTSVVNNAATATNTAVFSSVFISLIFNVSLSMLWGSINALQIICCLSFNNVAWPANINFVFNLLNQITQFDLVDPFSPIPIVNVSIYDWNWSPTDPQGNNLAIVNGGSLTFLPNLGSVALFIHLALIQTMIAPVTKLMQAIGIKGKGNLLRNITPDSDRLSNQWLRIFLEAFISLYMFLLLGFQMAKQIPPGQRNSQDEWSVDTQYALMVPTLAFPFLIIWFASINSRWLVQHRKAQFYVQYHSMIRKNLANKQKELVIDMNSNSEIKGAPQTNKADAPEELKKNDDEEIGQQHIEVELGALQDPNVAKNEIQNKLKIESGQFEQSDKARQETEQDKDVQIQRYGKNRSGFGKFGQKYVNNLGVSRQQLKEQEAKLDSYVKFAVLHEELNLLSQSSQYYWVIFIMRRVIFLTVCVYTNDSYVQSATYTISSMISGAYMAAAFPFEVLSKNYIENFNEVIVFVCGVFQMVLAGYTFDGVQKSGEPDQAAATRQFLANLIIAAVVILLIVNLYATLTSMAHQLSLDCKRRYARWSAIKRMNKRKIILQKYQANESEISYHYSREVVDESQQESSRQLLTNNQIPVPDQEIEVSIQSLQENVDVSEQPPEQGLVRLDSLIIGGGSVFQSANTLNKSVAATSYQLERESVLVQNLPTARPKRNIEINGQKTENSLLVARGNLLSDKSEDIEPLKTDRYPRSSDVSRKHSLIDFERVELKLDSSRSDNEFDRRSQDNPQLIRKTNKQSERKRSNTAFIGEGPADGRLLGAFDLRPPVARRLISRVVPVNLPPNFLPDSNQLVGELNNNSDFFADESSTNIKVLLEEYPNHKGQEGENLVDVSEDSDQLQYVDKVRDRLKEQVSVSQDELIVEHLSSIDFNLDSSDDQNEGLEDRSQNPLGNDYNGDLRSSRILNQSQAQERDQRYENRVNGLLLEQPKQQFKLDSDYPGRSTPTSVYMGIMKEPEPEVNDL